MVGNPRVQTGQTLIDSIQDLFAAAMDIRIFGKMARYLDLNASQMTAWVSDDRVDAKAAGQVIGCQNLLSRRQLIERQVGDLQ